MTTSGEMPGAPASRRGLLAAVVAIVVLLLVVAGAVLVWCFSGEQEAPSASGVAVDAAAVSVMEPPGLTGRIMTGDWQGISGAKVSIVLPGERGLRMSGGMFETERPGDRIKSAVSGEHGIFAVPGKVNEGIVAVTAKWGFAVVGLDQMPRDNDIRLTQWGNVKGRYMRGTKPGANIQLRAVAARQINEAGGLRLTMMERVKTDDQGYFSLEHVPPGMVMFNREYAERAGTDTMVYLCRVGHVDVDAGETATVSLGGVGRPVVGKFVFPEEMHRSDYFLNARAGEVNRGADDSMYFLNVDDHDNFRMENVPPGDYRIHIFVLNRTGARAAQEEMPEFTMPDVAGGVSDDPLVIPDIHLKP